MVANESACRALLQDRACHKFYLWDWMKASVLLSQVRHKHSFSLADESSLSESLETSDKKSPSSSLLKLFSVLLRHTYRPNWPRRITPRGSSSLALYRSSGLLYTSHFILFPSEASFESFALRRPKISYIYLLAQKA